MDHLQTTPRFEIPNEALLPTACPACGYSWQGLPESRCPECGERVEAGEVVIVGEWLPNRGAAYTGENWKAEILGMSVSIIVAAPFLIIFKRASFLVTGFISGALILIMGVLIALVGYFRGRVGFPAGVLRLSKQGWTRGAGERKGPIRPWHSSLRVETQLSNGTMRITCFRRWHGISLWRSFDVRCACSSELYHGILERLQLWKRGTPTV